MWTLRLTGSQHEGATLGRRGRAGRGFTLIELFVTLAVLSIALTLAAPSFADFVRSNRLKTASFELVASLNYARSEALKRSRDATVTPAGGGWSAGWSVRAEGQTLRVFEAPAGVAVTPVADGAAWAAPVTFRRNGRPSGFGALLFTIRRDDLGDNRFVRCVFLDLGGDATIREDANRDGDCSNG